MFFLAIFKHSKDCALRGKKSIDILATVVEDIKACRCAAPDLSDCLLPSQSPRVLAEIKHRNSRPRDAEDPAHFQWPDLHRSTYKKEDKAWGTGAAWRSQAASNLWKDMLPVREWEVLELEEFRYSGKRAAKMGKWLGSDIGQSINRVPKILVRADGTRAMPTLLPGSKIWLTGTIITDGCHHRLAL